MKVLLFRTGKSSGFHYLSQIKKLFQKQPARDVPWKRCSVNMQQIYRRTPMPKYDFNKVALQL